MLWPTARSEGKGVMPTEGKNPVLLMGCRGVRVSNIFLSKANGRDGST